MGPPRPLGQAAPGRILPQPLWWQEVTQAAIHFVDTAWRVLFLSAAPELERSPHILRCCAHAWQARVLSGAAAAPEQSAALLLGVVPTPEISEARLVAAETLKRLCQGWLAGHDIEPVLEAELVRLQTDFVDLTAPLRPRSALEPPQPAAVEAARDDARRDWLQSNAHAALLRTALAQPESLRAPGVLGSRPLDFGVQLCGGERLLFRGLQVCNDSASGLLLLGLRLEPDCHLLSLHDDLGLGAGSAAAVLLPPGARYDVTVRLRVGASAAGLLACWLLATLETADGKRFVAGRRATAAVLDQRALAARSALSGEARPFVPARLRELWDRSAALLVLPPAHTALASNRAGLPILGAWIGANSAVWTPPPPASGQKKYKVQKRAMYLEFTRLFRLLRLEEAATAKALRTHDMFCVPLQRGAACAGGVRGELGALYTLRVPGLAENRPAVAMADFLHIRSAASDVAAEGLEVAAPVHSLALRDSTVTLWLGASTALMLAGVPPDEALSERCAGSMPESLRVHVRFSVDALLFQRISSAMAAETAVLPNEARPALLPGMPLPPLRGGLQEIPRLAPMNPLINEEQAQCVHRVCSGMADGAPYCLYGPPGTGKTMTVVECALQLLQQPGRGRILLCAPSPSAADILCARLAEAGVGVADMARINDPRRLLATIMPGALPFSRTVEAAGRGGWTETRTLCALPMPAELPLLRLFVATCASAALLRKVKLCFDAVLVDEAGQATAPETLIALCAPLTHTRTAILLAGDPRQLGPVLHSRAAAAAGLSQSLLERFADAASGPTAGGARKRMTQLVRNYRSHEDVLTLPSSLFYGGSLQCCALGEQTSMPDSWAAQQGMAARCRVHFHGVQGAQSRDGDAPSWFNAQEAAAVVEIVEELIAEAGLEVHDIGVVATFRKQVQLLRTLFRSRGLGGVRVGTVDDYQGQQERVMVISTVLTRVAMGAEVGDDALGFLANPRRFNVAVTRAKALNIVVGHPVPLSQWPHWHALMRHAIARGAYTGAGAEESEEVSADGGELRKAVRRMAALSLLGGGWDEEAAAPEELYAEEQGFRVAF